MDQALRLGQGDERLAEHRAIERAAAQGGGDLVERQSGELDIFYRQAILRQRGLQPVFGPGPFGVDRDFLALQRRDLGIGAVVESLARDDQRRGERRTLGVLGRDDAKIETALEGVEGRGTEPAEPTSRLPLDVCARMSEPPVNGVATVSIPCSRK
jgi:hypothetical protein